MSQEFEEGVAAIDYSNAVVRRLPDRRSISTINLEDRVRSFFVRRRTGVDCGDGTVFKRGARVVVSEGGQLHIGPDCVVHRGVLLLLTLPHPRVRIGKSVFIGESTIIAAKNQIEIGDFTVFAPRCYVIDHEHGFARHDLILNQLSVLKSVRIGRDCYFGTGSTVLAGVTIGDGVIVGAGSVVTRSIPDGQVWAGNPAKFIKSR